MQPAPSETCGCKHGGQPQRKEPRLETTSERVCVSSREPIRADFLPNSVARLAPGSGSAAPFSRPTGLIGFKERALTEVRAQTLKEQDRHPDLSRCASACVRARACARQGAPNTSVHSTTCTQM